jgi:misacylated tRNA(Ala) deacylase
MADTHRLGLDDATVREWDAVVVASYAEQGIVLDRSALYPGGGGHPPDEGVLLWGGCGRGSPALGRGMSYT